MMKKTFKKIALFAVGAMLAGCSSILNPYSENFQCPLMEEGKCVSVHTAYQESKESKVNITLEEKSTSKALRSSALEESYYDELFSKLTRLLKDPQTPLLVPPKVVRVMILPYQDVTGKEFYSARYVYIILEDPKWIIQNSEAFQTNE